MDEVKLKNSCICGNTLPYAECCGRFAGATGAAVSVRASFRHDLHELFMYLFPLRNLYQAYWERLSQEEYPHHLLMADPDYGRAVMSNFFWDYSVQFSDARPILRAARDIEEKNLRLANDFRQWSLSPLWVWDVIESDDSHAHVRMADSGSIRRVSHGGELPPPGNSFAGRILPYRGEEQIHPAVLAFPLESMALIGERLRAVCRRLGVKAGSGLRPDVQCEEWRSHGAQVLALWREAVYDARVGVPGRTMTTPQSFQLPVPGGDVARQLEAGGALSLGRGRFELRYRALSLGRLELEPGGLRVTLMDQAYRSHVFRWLADHTGSGAEEKNPEAPSATTLPIPEDWREWVEMAQPSLNGESPMQASLHDIGRRRLARLVETLPYSGDALSALRSQLGL